MRLQFKRERLPVGGSRMVAYVSDEDFASIVEVVRAAPYFRVLETVADDKAQAPTASPEAAPAAESAEDAQHALIKALAEQALRNGWTLDDIGGGPDMSMTRASIVSGLTLPQMALCARPAGFDAATSYPWEYEGWTAPSIDWSPPTVPAKRGPDTGPDAGPPAADLEPVDLDSDALVPEEDDADGAAEPVDLATYGDEDTVARAREVLAGIRGSVTQSKANYHLKKNGLPLARPEQVRALVGK